MWISLQLPIFESDTFFLPQTLCVLYLESSIEMENFGRTSLVLEPWNPCNFWRRLNKGEAPWLLLSLRSPESESFFFSIALFGMVMHWLELDRATIVSRSGQDKCAILLSTLSEPPEEVLFGRIRNSGDKDDVLEIPDETDWSDWSELELEDSQIDIECRCSIRLELESCWRLQFIEKCDIL